MRLMWVNTMLSVVAVVAVAGALLLLHEQIDDTIRLLITLVVVFIGIYRISDVVRQE